MCNHRPMDRRTAPDLKADLHERLRRARTAMLSKLDGLTEYDRRRPMTPTGTNLLGLVKHLAGVEYAYFGESFGRPAPESLAWVDDGSIRQDADMWATADQTSEYLIGLYQRACAHADQTIADHDLDSPATVAHWRPENRSTTLGLLLVHMLAETARHAGHADIIRELIDGRPGPDQDGQTAAQWAEHVARIQAAADSFS